MAGPICVRFEVAPIAPDLIIPTKRAARSDAGGPLRSSTVGLQTATFAPAAAQDTVPHEAAAPEAPDDDAAFETAAPDAPEHDAAFETAAVGDDGAWESSAADDEADRETAAVGDDADRETAAVGDDAGWETAGVGDDWRSGSVASETREPDTCSREGTERPDIMGGTAVDGGGCWGSRAPETMAAMSRLAMVQLATHRWSQWVARAN